MGQNVKATLLESGLLLASFLHEVAHFIILAR